MKYRTIVIDPPWAIDNGFCRMQFKGDVKEALPYDTMPDKPKYKTVVIDPPWRIQTGGPQFVGGGIVSKLPYAVQKDSTIMEFPIDDFAEPECDLFMWATHSKIPAALEILKAWGFRYNFMLTWHKNGGITCQGFHLNSEFILYAYRGVRQLSYTGTAIKTVFEAKRGKHSEKPSTFYDMIRDKTKHPRIDIFARRRHAGFEAWGDQVEPMMQEVLK